MKACFKRVKPARELKALKDCTLVVEAATERLEGKQAIFRELDALGVVRGNALGRLGVRRQFHRDRHRL